MITLTMSLSNKADLSRITVESTTAAEHSSNHRYRDAVVVFGAVVGSVVGAALLALLLWWSLASRGRRRQQSADSGSSRAALRPNSRIDDEKGIAGASDEVCTPCETDGRSGGLSNGAPFKETATTPAPTAAPPKSANTCAQSDASASPASLTEQSTDSSPTQFRGGPQSPPWSAQPLRHFRRISSTVRPDSAIPVLHHSSKDEGPKGLTGDSGAQALGTLASSFTSPSPSLHNGGVTEPRSPDLIRAAWPLDPLYEHGASPLEHPGSTIPGSTACSTRRQRSEDFYTMRNQASRLAVPKMDDLPSQLSYDRVLYVLEESPEEDRDSFDLESASKNVHEPGRYAESNSHDWITPSEWQRGYVKMGYDQRWNSVPPRPMSVQDVGIAL